MSKGTGFSLRENSVWKGTAEAVPFQKTQFPRRLFQPLRAAI